ncbi:DUF3068 domain-containing protein [Streptosporangium longisporum]|uniref:DUF3068 domain-containing protein n=1 Tax=Streptosporangium longisporum TaxID=46187 RepID=A0ABN3XUB1_9ACTN
MTGPTTDPSADSVATGSEVTVPEATGSAATGSETTRSEATGSVATGRGMSGERLRGVLVLAAGAFLITLAALVRLYVYPSGLVLPAEQNRITMLTTESGSYLDTAALRVRSGVPLEQAVARYGDTVRSTPDVAVWTEFVSLATRSGQRVDYHERRLAFDRRTAQAFPCCEDYVDENPDPAPRGLLFRWPFEARPIAYQVYDPLARRPVAARFDGIETLHGVRVYRYAQRLVDEPYVQQPMRLPGSVLGLGEPEEPEERKTAKRPEKRRSPQTSRSPGAARTTGTTGTAGTSGVSASDAELFPVDAYLNGTRTFWVEPTSGMVIGFRENLVRTLRTPDGRGRVIALAADLRTSTGDERWNAGEARQFQSRATLVNLVIPISFLVLGVAVLVAGVRLTRAAGVSSGRDGGAAGAGAAPEPRPADG